MGHLEVLMRVPSYLTKFSSFSLLLLTVVVLATAQNCVFKDVAPEETEPGSGIWLIRGEPISERTSSGATIWDVQTENILASRSYQVPHGEYLTGLRYTSRYVYRTSESFPNFMRNEQTTEVLRDVVFDCEDDQSLRVHFRFPLIDVNDPPEFTAYPRGDTTNIDVDLATVREDTILNEGEDFKITVRDPDFDPSNTQLQITSDRRELILTEVASTEEGDNGVGKSYHLNLKLNMTGGTDSIDLGIYSLNLIASDGEFTASARIRINVFKSA